MAGNVRHWALSKYDSTHNLLDNVMIHLLEIADAYQEYHPEIANPTREIAQALIIVQETLDNIRATI